MNHKGATMHQDSIKGAGNGCAAAGNSSAAPACGLDRPFELLFEENPRTGLELPDRYIQVYKGSWNIPRRDRRPYVYSNFVISRDGRVSFIEEGFNSGGPVSGYDRHDRWLMALLRARADAVLIGDMTLKAEPDHLWTAEYIFPEASSGFFSDLRVLEGRAPVPIHCIVSLTGDIPEDTEAIRRGYPVIIATTGAGMAVAEAKGFPANVAVLLLGETLVDLGRLLDLLSSEYGAQTVLCEGGPRLYAHMLEQRLVDEEFLTLSPVVVGEAGDQPRPSLVEGVAFRHNRHPRSLPNSMRRVGHYFYVRATYDYPG